VPGLDFSLRKTDRSNAGLRREVPCKHDIVFPLYYDETGNA
jgi:hypothetical protein